MQRKILIMGLPGAGKRRLLRLQLLHCLMPWLLTPMRYAPIFRATSASATKIASSTHVGWAGCAIGLSKRAAR